MRILVTGAAGFIGYHTCERLLARGDQIIGLDNLSEYYDVELKHSRLAELRRHRSFSFSKVDLADPESVLLFRAADACAVIHLAAQPGVRYSLQNPRAYVDSNIVAFVNVLEGCRHADIQHLVYASSSSVYGANQKLPFAVADNVDHPVSLYAATKKANELMAHVYSHIYRLPSTGLRFFTVYGPWARPDMAISTFTKAILEGRPIELFNGGNMERDFTYIDDIVEGIARVLDRPPGPGGPTGAPYKIYNIGNHDPVRLTRLIEILENCLGKKAHTISRPIQPGDLPATCADVSELSADMGFQPCTPIETGLRNFVEWHLAYYGRASCRAVSA